jgi:hypothetical protein
MSLAFQQAVVETLTIKCKRALKQTGLKRLVIAGGVSANKALRASLEKMLGDMKGDVFYARPEFCTDNGAMIAFAGCQRLQAGQQKAWRSACRRAGRWSSCRRCDERRSGRYLKMPFAPGKQVAQIAAVAPDDHHRQHAHRQQRLRLLPGQQWQGQGRGDQRGQRAGAGQVERQQPGADRQQRGGGYRPSSMPAAVATPLPPRKRKYSGNRWPITAQTPIQA